jgi:hypothetical protein
VRQTWKTFSSKGALLCDEVMHDTRGFLNTRNMQLVAEGRRRALAFRVPQLVSGVWASYWLPVLQFRGLRADGVKSANCRGVEV